jgi:hypothetical protein
MECDVLKRSTALWVKEKRWGGEAGRLHRGPRGAEHYEEGVRGGAGLPHVAHRSRERCTRGDLEDGSVCSAGSPCPHWRPTRNASRRSSPRANDTATPAVGPGRKDGAHVLDTLQIRQRFSVSHLVRGCYRMVELRGLEPLTFSLRRHCVHLVRREPSVIDVHGAAAQARWLQPGGTNGAHGRIDSWAVALTARGWVPARACISSPGGEPAETRSVTATARK